MAELYKILGQSSPNATTVTTLYTVPSATQAVISTISVCNRGTSTGSFRISIRPNGEALANKHYIVYDSYVATKDTIFISIAATISSADIVEIYCSSADFSISLFGSEIS